LPELLASIESFAGQQAVAFVQDILQRNRNHGAERIRVDLSHRQDGSFGLTIGGQTFTVPPPTRHLPNTPEEIQGEFQPHPTMHRWQEEMSLFPYTSTEQVSRMVLHIINRLLPAAREASARDAERLRKEEAERAERLRKEEEEAAAEAAKKREEEQAQAASVALPESRPETSQGGAIDEDIDMASDSGDHDEDGDEEGEEAPEESNRVRINIRGQEIDITDTGIDLEFLQALPEDMRAEVVEHHLREQNLLMPGAAANVPESSHIHSDFLNALPDDIRAEVLMQEEMEAAREQARRQAPPPQPGATEPEASGSGGVAPGTIRDLETEIRGTLRGDDLRGMLAHTIGLPPGVTRKTPAKKKTGPTATVMERKPLQLLDKPGIWALLRLLFVRIPLRESYLLRTLVHLCENDETRTELLNTLLGLVQDGTGDLPAVDRSFQQMSLRGLTTTPKAHATPSSKAVETPGPIANSLFADLQPEHVPTFIAQRCFEALQHIVNSNKQAVSYFLTEHELPVGLKKHSKKGKGKEKFLPQKQFPVVVLMSLLDRTELLKAPGMIESLTSLLSSITKPLTALQNWRQRVEKELSKPDKPTEGEEQPATGASGSEAAPAADTTVTKAEAKPVEWKMERPMFPPAILRLVINGLTIGDQTSRTFSSTLMVLQNLSSIPDAKHVLVEELCARSQKLGTVILGELTKLSKVLENKEHEVSSLDLVDFSAGSSSQTQLLRLLKTIDYLHSPKSSAGKTEDPAIEKRARELYQSFDFAQLWKQLGDCLGLAEARGSTDQIASMLLPLVESLMVVCKYTRPPGQPNPADIVSPVLSPTMPAQSSDLFLSFTTAHRKVLNSIVRSNPALLSGSFSLLVQNPRVLEFDNKRSWFFQRLKRKRSEQQAYHPLQLNVRRQYVFQDSFSALLHRPGEEVKYGKINVRFINEDGIDAGGVTREWYHVLAQQIFDPDYALFEPCAADNQTYQPNKHSSVNPDHLSYFKFVGRVIGKAIYDGRLLDAYFNRAFYKQILGRACDIRDLEAIDPEYHKSLQWMLENDITDVIDQEFTIEDESFGAKQIVELKPDGASIPVTEANKDEYVRLVCAYRLENSVKEQMKAFLTGFYEMIPRELVQIFEPEQLELLISGVNTFDVDELKNSTQISGWKGTDVEISWFWRALRSFSQEERARFLIFVTASSRVPIGGFEKLQGASGTQPFQIQKLYGKVGILPQASTCFNLLLLPSYESYEQLRERLLFAVTETEGFGKA
jgi:E3 ubiquitin-protein ligase HUWE1